MAHHSHTEFSRDGFLRHETETIESPSLAELAEHLSKSPADELEEWLSRFESVAEQFLPAADASTQDSGRAALGSDAWFAAEIVAGCRRVRQRLADGDAAAATLEGMKLTLRCREAWEADTLGPEVVRDRSRQDGAVRGGEAEKKPELWRLVETIDAALRADGEHTSKSARARVIVGIVRNKGHDDCPGWQTLRKRLP